VKEKNVKGLLKTDYPLSEKMTRLLFSGFHLLRRHL